MRLSKLYEDAFGKYREATLYIIFGGLTTVINWGAYAVFVWAGIEINLSNILSWIVGVSFAFVVNKWYVFESKSLEKTAVLKEFGSFVGSRVVTGVIAVVLFPILYAIGLNQSMFGVDGLWAKIVTSIIEIILNWVFSKYIVFKKGAHSQ